MNSGKIYSNIENSREVFEYIFPERIDYNWNNKENPFDIEHRGAQGIHKSQMILF